MPRAPTPSPPPASHMPAAGPPRGSPIAFASNLVRHAIPLALLYGLRGTLTAFLLLTAFNLSLGLIFIIGSTRDKTDPTSVDPRSRWLVMRVLAIVVIAAFLAFVAALIMVPVALPAFLLGVSAGIDWTDALAQNGVRVSAAVMALMAALRYQDLFEAHTTPGAHGAPTRDAPVIGDLESDRRRSLADYAAQVTLIATYVLMCFVLIEFRGTGLRAFPWIYTAMLVFYDARPDLARRIFPQLWSRK